ncbi:MAG: nuclear transport factor 2 family protein [Janthinobacterium lividum]
MADQAHHETVGTLERRRIAAMLAADTDALDELLHSDLLFVHTNAHADDKDTYLEKLRSGAVRYFDAEHRIISVKIIGETALASFHLKLRAELASGSRQLNVVGLTVWVLHAGAWQMIAHQPTVTEL